MTQVMRDALRLLLRGAGPVLVMREDRVSTWIVREAWTATGPEWHPCC
jgi:hypothetical protein